MIVMFIIGVFLGTLVGSVLTCLTVANKNTEDK